jgi:hypothetical protein
MRGQLFFGAGGASHRKPLLLVLCFFAFLFVSERSQGNGPPATFRDSENLSDRKTKALTHTAYSGDGAAALTLARYYWLIKGDPLLSERYFILAARSGSQRGCDALIAFYVEPGGVFRPKHDKFSFLELDGDSRTR